MSDTDLLRRVASLIRAEWEGGMGGPFRHPARFNLAVADWLDAAAEHDETPCPAVDSALSVARAYLGELAQPEGGTR